MLSLPGVHGEHVIRLATHTYLRRLPCSSNFPRPEGPRAIDSVGTRQGEVSGLLPSSVSFTRPEGPSVVKLVKKSQGQQATQRRPGSE